MYMSVLYISLTFYLTVFKFPAKGQLAILSIGIKSLGNVQRLGGFQRSDMPAKLSSLCN